MAGAGRRGGNLTCPCKQHIPNCGVTLDLCLSRSSFQCNAPQYSQMQFLLPISYWAYTSAYGRLARGSCTGIACGGWCWCGRDKGGCRGGDSLIGDGDCWWCSAEVSWSIFCGGSVCGGWISIALPRPCPRPPPHPRPRGPAGSCGTEVLSNADDCPSGAPLCNCLRRLPLVGKTGRDGTTGIGCSRGRSNWDEIWVSGGILKRGSSILGSGPGRGDRSRRMEGEVIWRRWRRSCSRSAWRFCSGVTGAGKSKWSFSLVGVDEDLLKESHEHWS